MARGDPVFTKFDNAIRHSKKLHKLKPDERHVYWILNIICTEELRDVLLGGSYGPSYVAREADVDRRIALRSLRRMAQVRLIELTDKWSVFVYDVRDRHRKLPFHERPIWPPNGETLLTHFDDLPCTSKISDSGENYITTDPDTEIVTQRRGQLATPGAVDVKKLLEDQDRKRETEKAADADDDPKPWNQVTVEAEDEREVHLWFLQLWPHGEYNWEAEKNSLLSQYRTHGRNAYAYARGILIEHRRENKHFEYGELAYLNGIAREQAKRSPRK